MDNNRQNTTNINWFPGHMTKAKREIEEKVKVVDMIIELRDARIPRSSENPLLRQITNNKPRLIILTKIDKADMSITKMWMEQLREDNVRCMCLDLTKPVPMNQIISNSKELLVSKLEREQRKGIRPRAIRAMIIGIPNVGKSTLINRLANRKATITGDRPGVTKATQWIKVNNDFELLDTPGVLWPKFDDHYTAIRLAVTGAIRDQILPKEEVANFGLSYVLEYYPEYITKRFGIEICDDFDEMYQRLGEKRKIYKTGGVVDVLKVMDMFIKEIRDNNLGPMSWERIDDSRT